MCAKSTDAPGSFNGIFKKNLKAPADFVLFGAPYDGGSSFRTGARRAPQAIRHYSGSLNACTELGVDLSHLNARDDGDLGLEGGASEAFDLIQNKVSSVMDQGAAPIVLGGDHSISMPCIKAALSKHPNLKVLYFDAHPDLYPTFNDDAHSHACVLARALDDGLKGERITLMGVRAFNPIQARLAEDHGIHTVHIDAMDGFRYQSDDPVYVSFDIDVLDPAHAPGCGNPVPGGVSFRQALTLIHHLRVPIVGLDVVEVNPSLDPSGITSLAGARIVTEFLGQMAHASAA